MSPSDSEADRLYQLPVSEFTKARDELAKRSGSGGGEIRRLQKPNLAAWAVNQLYWRERGIYDALVKAAERRRAAQLASLEGKPADIVKTDAVHAAARRTALDRIRQVLLQAGEVASPSTLTAVNETLEALPADAAPGRLTRPLKPMGFEALAGLLKGGGPPRRPAQVVPFPPRPATRPSAADRKRAEVAAKREAEARKKEAARLAAELREARTREASAQAAVKRARAELTRAEQEREQLVARLETAEMRLAELSKSVRNAEREAMTASSARAVLEGRRA
jgi:hypothetical protein